MVQGDMHECNAQKTHTHILYVHKMPKYITELNREF